jgi:hypothetical protein
MEADDILFRLIVAADDGRLLDVKPTTLQWLDGIFCCRVLTVNCNDRVLVLSWRVFFVRFLILDSHWFRFCVAFPSHLEPRGSLYQLQIRES